MKENIIIVIPAYNPKENFVSFIQDLSQNNHIIVIDDGSNSKEIFKKINSLCEIIVHSNNQGKGRALKTGFGYLLQHYPMCQGIITADADGQHTIEDIEKIKELFKQYPQDFVIGVRNFKQKEVPLKSKIGNYYSNFYFYQKTGVKLQDTQTRVKSNS